MTAKEQWTTFYNNATGMSFPQEGLIRILKGTYPNQRMPRPKEGQTILDVGCGDGCAFPLFAQLGLHATGTEITAEIVATIQARLLENGIPGTIEIGTCASLPFADHAFDLLVAWNSCYYMGPDGKFEDHVAEMARVLKPGGWIVCSVPKASCFIFKDSEPDLDGYITIANDHFGLRNGERMRHFLSAADVESDFSSHFTNFCHASIDIDMFGLAYNWHVFTAERRT